MTTAADVRATPLPADELRSLDMWWLRESLRAEHVKPIAR